MRRCGGTFPNNDRQWRPQQARHKKLTALLGRSRCDMLDHSKTSSPHVLSMQRDFVCENLVKLSDALGTTPLLAYVAEIEKSDLRLQIEKSVEPVDFFRTKHWASILEFGLYRVAQYALIRVLRPNTVVETGVLHGLTTAFLLKGLCQNQTGCLVSIDLPSLFEEGPANRDGYTDTLPPGLLSGWAIPPSLRSRWTLRRGCSRDELPPICEAGALDYFVHDSEHTDATMRFEFECAWAALASDGILVADNIDQNNTFFEFCRLVRRYPYVAPVDPIHRQGACSGIRFGVIRK